MSTINESSNHIKIEGHVGRWHVIDWTYWKSRKVYLLEHDTYGDMSNSLIVDADGFVIHDDVWNGFSDLDDLD